MFDQQLTTDFGRTHKVIWRCDNNPPSDPNEDADTASQMHAHLSATDSQLSLNWVICVHSDAPIMQWR